MLDWIKFFISKYAIIGLATKIEEYVPTKTPTIRANAKFLITSPPNKNKTTTTINVVKDVITVRLNDAFNDLFIITSNESFWNFILVSLILNSSCLDYSFRFANFD